MPMSGRKATTCPTPEEPADAGEETTDPEELTDPVPEMSDRGPPALETSPGFTGSARCRRTAGANGSR